jgi:hypothetical protein
MAALLNLKKPFATFLVIILKCDNCPILNLIAKIEQV